MNGLTNRPPSPDTNNTYDGRRNGGAKISEHPHIHPNNKVSVKMYHNPILKNEGNYQRLTAT